MEKKKGKDRGFKTAPDGRLIIEDDSSDSEAEKNKKGISLAPDSDSDDGNSSAAETLPLTNRKRKRADSASVKSSFSRASSHGSMKYTTGGVGIHR